MHFTDTAIILSVRKHGEHSAIVRALTREHGLYAGAVRGALGKAGRGLWQPGNHVLVTWKARTSEQLGAFSGELIEAVAAFAMQDSGRLAALSSASALILALVPERAPHVPLYDAFAALTAALKIGSDWQENYARFELTLLAECGFVLDFSTCAATGGRENLTYVSPKSGRAVSTQAGAPYKEKLLKLPGFLAPQWRKNRVEPEEILASLRLTGYFLEHWCLTPHEKKFPPARARLLQQLTTYLAYEPPV